MASTIYPGNATPDQVLANQKFSAGTEYNATGDMPNNGALGRITPSVVDILIPAGYTDGGTIAGDTNLVATNILSGKSIFGVAGSVAQGIPAANGTVTSSTSTIPFTTATGSSTNFYYVTVSGLTFQPVRIVLLIVAPGQTEYIGVYDVNNTLMKNPTVCNYVTSIGSANTGFAMTGNAYVNATGFQLPSVGSSGSSVKWYAYSE